MVLPCSPGTRELDTPRPPSPGLGEGSEAGVGRQGGEDGWVWSSDTYVAHGWEPMVGVGRGRGSLEDKKMDLVSNSLGQSAKPSTALPASGHTAGDECLMARPLPSKRGREQADTSSGRFTRLHMTNDFADTRAGWRLHGTRLASGGGGQKAYYVPDLVLSKPQAPTPP